MGMLIRIQRSRYISSTGKWSLPTWDLFNNFRKLYTPMHKPEKSGEQQHDLGVYWWKWTPWEAGGQGPALIVTLRFLCTGGADRVQRSPSAHFWCSFETNTYLHFQKTNLRILGIALKRKISRCAITSTLKWLYEKDKPLQSLKVFCYIGGDAWTIAPACISPVYFIIIYSLPKAHSRILPAFSE